MQHTLGFLCAAFLVLGLAQQANARDADGFYLGLGPASTGSSDCGADCDTSGAVFEGGYDINRIVGVEFQYYDTELDNFDDSLRIHYGGVNLGHNFDLPWFRLYGKAGIATITEEFSDAQVTGSETETNLALGMGVRFTPIDYQRGFYIRAEVMGSSFYDDDLGIASLGFGYKF